MSCQDEFALTEKNGDKCKVIRQQFPNCECEDESVSPHSQGVVLSFEYLARSVFSPIHIDLEGNLLPTIVDDAANKGMSVNRQHHISSDELNSIGENKAQNDRMNGISDRQYLGYSYAKCEEIRSLIENGKRVCCIYDTATENTRSHADICYNFYAGKATKKKLRKVLFELFENHFTPVATK